MVSRRTTRKLGMKKRLKGVSPREEIRRRGYKALTKGIPQTVIAATLGVNRITVNRWDKRRKKNGPESWRDVPRPGPAPKLNKAQGERLKRILLRGALEHGYPSELWTLKRVAEVIKKEFGVEYNVTHVWRVLRGLGFSPQVPQQVAMERDDKRIREWVLNEWPKIVDLAREIGATILFLDECAVQSHPNVHRTWAPKGARPKLLVREGKRDKLSLISAVTTAGELYFSIHEKAIKGPEVMVFLHHLLREIPGKVIVVWDSGGIHRSVEVKEFLWLNRKRLVTRRFPTYAPHLNPDEQVWMLAKDKDLANWRPRDIVEMKRVVRAELLKLARQKGRVGSAICHAQIPLPVKGRLPRGWRRRLTV